MTLTTSLIISDIQFPLHDPLMLRKLVKVAEVMQPDQIIQIGDGVDFTETGQWTKGTAGEYAPTLQKNIDGYTEEVLVPLAEAAPKSRRMWLMGNHDERLEAFVRKYAFPLTTLRALEMESLFNVEALGWTIERGLTRIGTNTYMIHGHEAGGYSSTLSAWDLKFIKRYGSDKNFVFGHTHQPGILTRAFGARGKVDPRWTMNVGSIMDPVKATYVKDGAPSWVMGFGILRDDGKRVWPELVTATDRKFYFEGERF